MGKNLSPGDSHFSRSVSMDADISLRSQLLIAMPTLNDPGFNKALVLICKHSLQDGAMGIVINQPSGIGISELVYEQGDSRPHAVTIHAGGPVDTGRGFILHDSPVDTEATLEISPCLFLTSSNKILQEIMCGGGPKNSIIVLGYAGWAPGQLEAEISANAWLVTDYCHQLVFATAAQQQWLAAGQQLGIDLNLVTSDIGHA